MYDDVETVKAKKKVRAHGQDCSTIFRRVSKPLTKSGLESPFLMLPSASYGDVCACPARTHQCDRTALAKKNISSVIVCFRRDSARPPRIA